MASERDPQDFTASGIGDGPPDFTLTVEVRDLGDEPDWHKDRRLYQPWWRYEARITDGLAPLLAADVGTNPTEAIQRAASRLRKPEVPDVQS